MRSKLKKCIQPTLLIIFATWLLLGIDVHADFELSDSEGSSINGDTVLIRLSEDLEFHWSNTQFDVIEDSLYSASILVYTQNRQLAVQQVTNLTKTYAKACTIKTPLNIGDMAVVFIDKVDQIPYRIVFKKQFCVIYSDCLPFRRDALNYVSRNRTLASLQIGHFVESISYHSNPQ